MQRKISKILCVLLILLFMGTTITPNVSAASFYVTQHWFDGWDFDWQTNWVPGITTRYGVAKYYTVPSGAVAYCIEKNAPTTNSNQPEVDKPSHLTAQQISDLAVILLYGYDGATRYGYSWQVEFNATQCFIWSYLEGWLDTQYEEPFLNGYLVPQAAAAASSRAAFQEVYYKIKEQFKSHYIVPSFAAEAAVGAPTYTTTYNAETGQHTLTLTDTNNVLQYYNIAAQLTAAGIPATQSGNKLTISSTTPITLTDPIKGERIANLYVSSIFLRNNYGFLEGSQQAKMMMEGTKGLPDPVPGYFRLESELMGQVKIIKTSSFDGQLVPGATYGIYQAVDDKLMDTLVTGADGTATSIELPFGSYYVQEITPPDFYLLNNAKYPFEIDEAALTGLVEISVTDAPMIGTLRLEWDGAPPTVILDTVPRTGDNPAIWGWTTLTASLVPCALLLVYHELKRQKKGIKTQ